MHRPLKIENERTAVLFIDLQEEHRKDERYLVEGFDAVLKNARKLQKEARHNNIRLIHCAYIVDAESGALRPFHPMTSEGLSAFSDKSHPDWTAICREVEPAPGETLLIKTDASAFADGRLEPVLRSAGIEWLFVAGVWTEACVEATVKDAVKLGFRVVLV